MWSEDERQAHKKETKSGAAWGEPTTQRTSGVLRMTLSLPNRMRESAARRRAIHPHRPFGTPSPPHAASSPPSAPVRRARCISSIWSACPCRGERACSGGVRTAASSALLTCVVTNLERPRNSCRRPCCSSRSSRRSDGVGVLGGDLCGDYPLVGQVRLVACDREHHRLLHVVLQLAHPLLELLDQLSSVIEKTRMAATAPR